MQIESFIKESPSLQSLKQAILNGQPVKSRFLSWCALLNVVSYENSTEKTEKPLHVTWNQELKEHEENYQKIKKTLQPTTHPDADPLSQDQENPWNQYFKDEDLKKTIRQDVERTFPDLQEFHTKEAQELLENVLFVWCKQHQDPSYRQGMHEIAAVVYWVVLQENSKDFEADTYILFTRIMAGLSNLYMGGTLNSMANHACSELLPLIDDVLAKSMEIQELEPNVYGIRWLRLLFAREFTQNGDWLERVCQLWDGIFVVEPVPTQPLVSLLQQATDILHPMENQQIKDARYNGIESASILEWIFCHFLCTARQDLVIPQKVIDYAAQSTKRVVYRNKQHVALKKLMKFDYPEDASAWMIVPTALHLRVKILEEVKSNIKDSQEPSWEVVEGGMEASGTDSLSDAFSKLMSSSQFWKSTSSPFASLSSSMTGAIGNNGNSTSPSSPSNTTDKLKSRLEGVVGNVLRKPPLMDSSPRARNQPSILFDLDRIRELVISSLSQCEAVLNSNVTEEDRTRVLQTVVSNLKRVIVTMDGDGEQSPLGEGGKSEVKEEVKEESSKEEVVKEESVKEEPVKEEPVKEEAPKLSPKPATKPSTPPVVDTQIQKQKKSLESPFATALPPPVPSVVNQPDDSTDLLANLISKPKGRKLRG